MHAVLRNKKAKLWGSFNIWSAKDGLRAADLSNKSRSHILNSVMLDCKQLAKFAVFW